jgi:hypothetical protein
LLGESSNRGRTSIVAAACIAGFAQRPSRTLHFRYRREPRKSNLDFQEQRESALSDLRWPGRTVARKNEPRFGSQFREGCEGALDTVLERHSTMPW